jgi:hypothetical protein
MVVGIVDMFEALIIAVMALEDIIVTVGNI